MPAAPRPSKKAEEIVYRILGKPSNMQKTKRKQHRQDKLILVEETRLLR